MPQQESSVLSPEVVLIFEQMHVEFPRLLLVTLTYLQALLRITSNYTNFAMLGLLTLTDPEVS